MLGFEVVENVPRFVPYTTRSRLRTDALARDRYGQMPTACAADVGLARHELSFRLGSPSQ